MEGNIAALKAKNDEAAARELRELRADTIEGLKYLHELVSEGEECIENALASIEEEWPA